MPRSQNLLYLKTTYSLLILKAFSGEGAAAQILLSRSSLHRNLGKTPIIDIMNPMMHSIKV